MKLEKQVCSLELAKQLKKLGVMQNSYFLWVERRYQRPVTGPSPMVGVIQSTDINRAPGDNPVDDEILASAFTVAELGEMLPISVVLGRKTTLIKQTKGNNGVHGLYGLHLNGVHGLYGLHLEGKITIEMICALTEADARAKMLIYLLENHLIGGTRDRSADTTQPSPAL